METKAKLSAKAIGRREMKNIEGYEFRESQNSYNRVFDPETYSLSLKNNHLWHFLTELSYIVWSDKRDPTRETTLHRSLRFAVGMLDKIKINA